ncbi:MAG: hypothetical protein VW689_05280 [Gammaproteobacteria bacterium]
MSKVFFHDVLRDGIQSLMGTNPSADEIISSYPTCHLTGCSQVQTAGGTFFDLFAKKGRDEWSEVEKIITYFKKQNVKQTALIRGDFLFGYEPYSYDVVEGTVLEFAKMGINIFHNFHGMNDHIPLIGVVEAVKKAQRKGYDIIANGTICIEDNPNITTAECLKFAAKLVDIGHEGFYLKSASGRLSPDFVYSLTSQLYNQFPDQNITIHAHSTYGEAPACYMAAILAAVHNNKSITIDVQHPALSGSTAQPSMTKMAQLIKNYPDKKVNAYMPLLNNDAIKMSLDPLLTLRFKYRDYEIKYDKELLDVMYKSRVPGGASSTLKSIPGLIDNLERKLDLQNDPNKWDIIQKHIYDVQNSILSDIGNPTQVTPYAANTTGQSAISLWNKLNNKELYDTLYPGIVNYLVGLHGKVPNSINKKILKKALDLKSMDKPTQYISSINRENTLEKASAELNKKGIKKPTLRQKLSYMLLDDKEHVVRCYMGENIPQKSPEFPFYTLSPVPKSMKRKYKDGKGYILDIRDAIKAIGGIPLLQEIAERVLHLKQINDQHYIFPDGYKDLGKIWNKSNITKLDKIIDDIDKKLLKHGFDVNQVRSFTIKNGQLTILECIRDVLEKRGDGLYEYFLNIMEKHNKIKNIEKVAPRDGLEPPTQ